ncbi:tryptophan synthase, alpha chain [Sulfurimonas denitrificans DSM 1251]|uniref:Tryptophan synthase alpha chain n=1 Tax=Sulfurimonas denitrificans (strain ATCC 33889 / DSM 1251) TaxID=326298 RepID=Q30PX3_SULDN|nr:tryptophan synthase subunit alpha [Sulfurimonas denitrificans]ABB44958.1 tryptophan synthase, alpha chain [Sulfurimonas denitrificans DSM 1251]MDD3442640.1 tryptophan synthase subunit alpha [Sulfurimonas denitrificans]
MKKLVAYITSGYPEKSFSIDLALALSQSGVDTLELGVPFSDPVADGPLIELANQKALEFGFRFKDLIEISKEIAPKVDTLWMGYFNSFYQQNMQKLLPFAKEIGLSGFIIPDLPHEESVVFNDLFNANALSNISFVAPTDTNERIEQLVKDSKKFIYMVAYTGITGSGKAEDLQPILSNIKKHTQTPIYVGFGVNKKTAKDKVKGADGVIVGSAFVEILLDKTLSYTEKIDNCSELAKILKGEINS